MKEIEKLLDEYKIRFRDTSEIQGVYRTTNFIPIIRADGIIYNEKGEIRNVNGVWKIADLKEAPKRWVIERDENNPIWEEFKDWYNSEMYNFSFYSYRKTYDES